MICNLKKPRLGITVLKESKIIVAVVPRTWFGKKVPDLIINNETKIIALPDKFERTLIVKEHSNSQKLIEDLKKGFYTDISKSEENRRKKEKRSVPKPKIWYRGKSLQSRSTNNNEVTDEDFTVKQNDDHSMAVGLFLLMWKYNSTSENKYEFLDQMSNFSLGGPSNLLFLGQFMLENIKRYMRELRRTYKEQTVQSVAVKGRIDLMRSAPNIASGIPLLTCRVDEFNIQSPHYSALMTAIEKLSSLSVGNGQGYLDTLVNHLKKEARKLRGVFREIPALDKSRAIRVLSNSSLPPQLRRWKSIFGYAANILKDNSGIENSDKDKVSGFTLPQIQSSVIWENILHSQIVKFGENVLPPEPLMINPWQQIGSELQASKKPDIFFTVKKGDRFIEVILDAKYYLRVNDKTNELDEGISANAVMYHNNWQMLGYAITPLEQDQTWKENSSRIVFMGFPTQFISEQQSISLGREYEVTNSLILDPITSAQRVRPTPILQSLGIPFPSYELLKNEFVDSSSLEKLDKTIAEQVFSRIDELYENHRDKLFP